MGEGEGEDDDRWRAFIASRPSAQPPVPTLSSVLFLRTLTSQADAVSRKPKPTRSFTLPTIVAKLQARLGNMWAPSTWRGRASLWRRLKAFCAARALPVSPDSATLFVVACGVAPSSEATYASSLAALFRQLGVESPSLAALARASRLEGDAETKQATPITKKELETFVFSPKTPLRLRVWAALCWASASRAADVAGLRAKNLLFSSEKEIVVQWGTVPKGRRRSPWRPSAFVVVTGSLTPFLHAHLPSLLDPKKPLLSNPQDGVRSLQSLFPPLSGHSFKRGALEVLLTHDPDPILLSRTLKHTSPLDPVPKVTIRYARRLVAVARWLGTGNVTRFL